MYNTEILHSAQPILLEKIKFFEEATGFTCITGGFSGSVAKGLTVKGSDWDYLVLFIKKDFPSTIHKYGEKENVFKEAISIGNICAEILFWDFTSINSLFNEFYASGRGGDQLNIFFSPCTHLKYITHTGSMK